MKDLLAVVGAFSYDDVVRNGELWVAVGQELRRLRTEAGHSSTIALASSIGDPHAQKTFDKLERWNVGQIKSVHRYCEALGTTLPDVLRRVLPAGELSLRAMQAAAAFHSAWINDQYRLVFRFEKGDAYDVEIIDYH